MIQLNISILLMAGATLFAKLVSLSADQITIFRSIFALPALWIFCLVMGTGLTLAKRRDYLIAIGAGVLLALHWTTMFYAVKVSTVSIATIALFTFPVITIFIEPFMFNQTLHRRDLVSGGVVLSGVALLVPDISFDNSAFVGVFWGVISAFAYALRNVLIRKHLNHCSGATVMFYQIVTIVVFMLPWLDWKADLQVDNRLAYLVSLGVIFTAVAHTLFVNSLKQMSAKTASLISCLHPFYSVILAAILLSEKPDIRTLAGGALIVATAIYETLGAQKTAASKL